MRQFLRDDRRRCLWFAAIVVLFAVIASRTGTDADWDLRNYHAYNAHALLTGRFWSDIAAAQLQTYYSPVSDIVFGALRDWLNDRPVLLNVVLSLPYQGSCRPVVTTSVAWLLTSIVWV